jgi:hypothetical protein
LRKLKDRIHQKNPFFVEMTMFLMKLLMKTCSPVLPDRIWGKNKPFSFENSELCPNFEKPYGFLKRPYGIPQMRKTKEKILLSFPLLWNAIFCIAFSFQKMLKAIWPKCLTLFLMLKKHNRATLTVKFQPKIIQFLSC